jgi:RNA polymerase sigma-70 factor (ECF subfamily)
MTEPAVRFETLIERHHDEIYAYLWRLLRNAGRAGAEVEAEDLTQEVFLRAYRAFGRLRADSNHRAWLFKIATNRAYTVLRQGRRWAEQRLPLDDESYTPAGEPALEQQLAAQETLEGIGRSIAALPPKQRAALVLRYVQGLDYASVARALDCSQESARANVYQALRRLRQEWTEERER